MLQRLHAPIGLDLGGENPESIALAAIAEIAAVMHGRPGGPLRERQSPIHERTPVPRRADADGPRETGDHGPRPAVHQDTVSDVACAVPRPRD
jgi:hypothetical protein